MLARPDTLGYRASKFVTRHRTGVAAAALVFVSLVGAVVITTRRLANQGLPDQASLGDSRGALESSHKALAIRERMAAEAPSDFVALYRVGIVHHRIGQILRETGDVRAALDHHRRGLQIAQEAARGLGGDFASRRRILVAHCHLSTALLLHKGEAELATGRPAAAGQSLSEAESVAGALAKKDPPIREFQALLARVSYRQGRWRSGGPP